MSFSFRSFLAIFALATAQASSTTPPTAQEPLLSSSESFQFDSNSSVPLHIHEYWMRHANSLFSKLTPSHTPCPFNAFAAVVVNHSAPATPKHPFGQIICEGVNGVEEQGNPDLHGEIAAINNCSRILKEQGFHAQDLGGGEAWADLTLYSTAEPCPMCASAIRWSGFKECVFATTRTTMMEFGWNLILISTAEVFARSLTIGKKTTLLTGVLANETDEYFKWQYNPDYPCPEGCHRSGNKDGFCVRI